MKNITLAIEEDVLDKVRVIAAQNRTTVNAMLRHHLADLAGRDVGRERARHELLELARNSKGRMRPGARFDRESAYAESAEDMRHEDIPNPSHRTILAALDRAAADDQSEREKVHDRELGRAEVYARSRERLLALIDATEGDRGGQSWQRASLYDR